MKRGPIALIAVALVLAVGLVVLLLTRHAGAGEGDDAAPTARVTTAVVSRQTLQDVASVYGVVQADPAGSTTVAAPRALIVSRVFVQAGQAVSAGQPLVEVASAPASDLAYRQSADAVTFAKADLARVQRLFEARLAASDQLTAAQKALADAQAGLASQQQQGAGLGRQTLTASEAAVVTNVAAAPGDHFAQDAPLVALARDGALSVRLGLEPSAGPFIPGQAVTVRPLGGGPSIVSHLTMIGRAADQTTKTLTAVAPVGGAALAIGSAVQADVVTGAHVGLAVPRAAVVFDETGTHVFVIAGDKAQRVFVTAGHDYGDQIEVSGPIAAGQKVAVQGAYELEDGMAVKTAP